MNIYIFDCPNPKGHFGYGHTDICYSPVSAEIFANRVHAQYISDESLLSVYGAVVKALESFQPEPHPDAGYSEPIRD